MTTPEPSLPETDRNDRPDPTTKRSSFTPMQRWVAESQLKVILVLIAVLSPIISFYLAEKTVSESHQRIWTYSTDATGAITYAPVELADAKAQVYLDVAYQVAWSYLHKSPKGYSPIEQELARRLFTKEGFAQIIADAKAARDDREKRNLYDDPHIANVESRDSKILRYRVTGFVVRSGAVDGLPLREEGDFTMAIELTPQSASADKREYPFPCARYYIKITWRDGHIEQYPPQ